MDAARGRKASANRANWLIDAGLYGGFVVAMLLDLTGVAAHEWLGAAVSIAAAYHLLVHWSWVRSTTGRLFGQASRRARRLWGLDAGLLLGFATIGATGLVISTWLDVALEQSSYLVWRDAHVVASVATLAALVLKVGLHWRWIVTVAERHVFGESSSAAASVAQAAPRSTGIGRREFIRLMSGVGATAALAAASALVETGGQVEASTDQTVASQASTATPTPSAASLSVAASPTATPTASVGSSTASAAQASSGSCTVQCAKRCAYPGRCRRYVDADGSGRCDLGECA